MDWTSVAVGALAAAAVAAAVGGGAWGALHWPQPGLRRAIHDNPLDAAAFAVGLFLLGVAVLFFATVPWGS
jgi:hypothetical protein